MALKSKAGPPLLPGKHKKTVFLLNKTDGFSFLLEKVDVNLFELTIATYDTSPEMNRTEYVLHCDQGSLLDLKAAINHITK